ncbi:MAG: serine/threonine-protein kinase, partial [Polyangiales bacterium]
MSFVAEPPPLGTLLDGRYRLTALLGEGGMGRVYEGEDMRLGRRVAVKVIYDDAGDATLAERLYREARAAARAEHHAVITTYGCGVDEELGLDYLVMERLDGETLGQRLIRLRVLPFPLIVRVGLEVADALAAVHGTGVVHRDLKPSNIFLASRGRRVDDVKLLDFGVAKLANDKHKIEDGLIVGTP